MNKQDLKLVKSVYPPRDTESLWFDGKQLKIFTTKWIAINNASSNNNAEFNASFNKDFYI